MNYEGLLLNIAPYVSCRGMRQNEVKVKQAGCYYCVYFQKKLATMVSGNFRSTITDDTSNAWNDTVFESNFPLILHRYK